MPRLSITVAILAVVQATKLSAETDLQLTEGEFSFEDWYASLTLETPVSKYESKSAPSRRTYRETSRNHGHSQDHSDHPEDHDDEES